MNFIQRDLDTMKNPKKLNLLIATMMKKYHLSLLEFLFQMILSSKNFPKRWRSTLSSIYWLLKEGIEKEGLAMHFRGKALY